MELRVSQYFLAVAREQNISKAAKSLHLSQPTLSTQLKALEDELGKPLLIRGTKGDRRVTLTEDGMILRKRAEEILQLVQKTEDEISITDETIAGNIFIGAGETEGVRYVIKAQHALTTEYPLVNFHIASGDGQDILESLDRGLTDFGLIFGEVDTEKYDYIEVPYKERWGGLMRKDSPLVQKEMIMPEDLWNQNLIISRQEYPSGKLFSWLQKDLSELIQVSTYSLLFNGALMVEEGQGYAICLDKIINTTGDSPLCFRPLYPTVESSMYVVWKKYQIFSRAADTFLDFLKNMQ